MDWQGYHTVRAVHVEDILDNVPYFGSPPLCQVVAHSAVGNEKDIAGGETGISKINLACWDREASLTSIRKESRVSDGTFPAAEDVLESKVERTACEAVQRHTTLSVACRRAVLCRGSTGNVRTFHSTDNVLEAPTGR